MGNGRYAATLSYKDWLAFNNAQRAHYKIVEDIVPSVVLQTLSAVYFPRASAALAVAWIVGKHTFSTNYVAGGPENRYSSVAALHMVATLGWLGLSVAGALKLSGLITPSSF